MDDKQELTAAVVTTALWAYIKPDGLRAIAFHRDTIHLTPAEWERGKREGVFDQPPAVPDVPFADTDLRLVAAVPHAVPPPPAQPPPAVDTAPVPVKAPTDPLAECMAALMRLHVPVKAGSPTARDALRAAGHRFGNDVIAAAVKKRKSRYPLSGTAAEQFE